MIVCKYDHVWCIIVWCMYIYIHDIQPYIYIYRYIMCIKYTDTKWYDMTDTVILNKHFVGLNDIMGHNDMWWYPMIQP